MPPALGRVHDQDRAGQPETVLKVKQFAHVPGQGGREGSLLVYGGRHEERQYLAARQDRKVAAHSATAPGTSAGGQCDHKLSPQSWIFAEALSLATVRAILTSLRLCKFLLNM